MEFKKETDQTKLQNKLEIVVQVLVLPFFSPNKKKEMHLRG